MDGPTNNDLYAVVDDRRSNPTLTAIDAELRRTYQIATAEGMVGERDLAEVLSTFRIGTGSRLIDLGCGSAGPSTAMARETGCSVVAIDISQARLDRVDRTVSIAPLCADLNRGVPLHGPAFDGALQFDSIVHIEAKDHYLSDVRRLLRPGGRLAITSSTNGPLDDEARRRLGDVRGTIWRLSTEALLAAITAAGFTVESVRSRREQVLRWHESRRDALAEGKSELLSEMRAEEYQHALDRSSSVAELLGQSRLDMVFVAAVLPTSWTANAG